MPRVDVAVIGGGQAGLAASYHLRRAGLDFVILDDQAAPGGAWQHGWDSLRLFSPAAYSPLPGWGMPAQEGQAFPTAEHVVGYLRAYERRYALPVHRPVRVDTVHDDGECLTVTTDAGSWQAAFVISATGTWNSPFVPAIPGMRDFRGQQMHTVSYRNPQEFTDQRVVIVGGGNSAAQILAEVSTVADTLWVTPHPPRFMPDDVDGRVLFDVATEARMSSGQGPAGLGDVVMVPSVKSARDRGVLQAQPMFDRITWAGIAWSDAREHECDAIIWCTGFRPTLGHLAPLDLPRSNGRPRTDGTRSLDEPRLFLLGYGDWTGPASATIIGASTTARSTVAALTESLNQTPTG